MTLISKMSDRTSDVETNYINQAHLSAASKNISPHPNQSPTDNYDYSDKYFVSPENDKNRLFENMRLQTVAAESITSIIPDYLQNHSYPKDENGLSRIQSIKSTLDNITSLSAYYLKSCGKTIVDDDLKQIIGNLQEKVDQFKSQIEPMYVTTFEEYGVTHTSSIPVFEQIIKEPNNIPTSVLEEKYGPDYDLFRDVRDWDVNNLTETIESKVRQLNSKEKDKYYLKKREEIITTIDQFNTFELGNNSNFDPLKTLNVLNGDGLNAISSWDTKNYADLSSQINGLLAEKTQLTQKLLESFKTTPGFFDALDYDQTRFVISKAIEQKKDSVITEFIKHCSTEQLLKFIDQDLGGAIPLDLSNFIFSDQIPPEMFEKQLAIGELTQQKLKTICSQTFQHNFSVYSMTIQFSSLLKEKDPSMCQENTHKIIESLPKSTYFYYHHIQQMTLMSSFVDKLFLQTLGPEDVDQKGLDKLLITIDSPDVRHDDVNAIFKNLTDKIKQKFQPSPART